jgi:gas vesicle protein
MNAHTEADRDHGFVIGFLAGTCFGAGLAIWLAPRLAAELRERVTDSARSLDKLASSERYARGTP